MLSRVAENLYWTSRYVERAENVARLLDVAYMLELDAGSTTEGAREAPPLDQVLTILACRAGFERTFPPEERGRESVLQFLTFERSQTHSILAMISRARENARATQESLSGEAWSHLNAFYLRLGRKRSRKRFRNSPSRFYERVKQNCILFDGLIDGTLPHTEVYHFLQLGRYLERANQISRILHTRPAPDVESAAETPLELVPWSSRLRICSAYEAYLQAYQDTVEAENVIRFLVLDPDFPRSIRFCIGRCNESLHAIAEPDGDREDAAEAIRQLGRLESQLRYAEADEIVQQGLGSYLLGIQQSCNRIGAAIHHAYFAS